MKFLFLLAIFLLNWQVCRSQITENDSAVFVNYYQQTGIYREHLPKETFWHVEATINRDSVTNPVYLKKIFNWELLLSDYSPEEKLDCQDYEVELIGLGKCYVHEMRFTEWHRFVQKKIYYVSSPRQGMIYIFNFQNVDFEKSHLVLTYNLRGNLTISKIYYDDSQKKFIMDDIKVIKRNDDDDDV